MWSKAAAEMPKRPHNESTVVSSDEQSRMWRVMSNVGEVGSLEDIGRRTTRGRVARLWSSKQGSIDVFAVQPSGPRASPETLSQVLRSWHRVSFAANVVVPT